MTRSGYISKSSGRQAPRQYSSCRHPGLTSWRKPASFSPSPIAPLPYCSEELDREAETLGRSSFDLYWRIDDLQRQQEASQSICFATYLRRISGVMRR